MAKVIMYSTDYCPYCVRAKQLLTAKQVAFDVISVDNDLDKRAEMQRLSGKHTVPQIFINDKAIGGCDELYALDANGQLDSLLAQ